jgi:hypothetical protein
LRAIGGAAVVNRLAHSYLEKRGARVTAASRQIARKRYSYRQALLELWYGIPAPGCERDDAMPGPQPGAACMGCRSIEPRPQKNQNLAVLVFL